MGGFFGAAEDYEKAYMPWDELMENIVKDNPEMYEEAELELEHVHAPADA